MCRHPALSISVDVMGPERCFGLLPILQIVKFRSIVIRKVTSMKERKRIVDPEEVTRTFVRTDGLTGRAFLETVLYVCVYVFGLDTWNMLHVWSRA